MALNSAVEELARRIRQKLCYHCFAAGQIKTEHDDDYYIFTHVCVKCGKNYIIRMPKKYIDSWEKEDDHV